MTFELDKICSTQDIFTQKILAVLYMQYDTVKLN